MEQNKLSLKNFPLSARVLATCFIMTFLAGYAVSILQIYDRSHFDRQTVIQYYRGDQLPADESIMLPQSFATILSVTHVHAFSQPILFAALGLIYFFSGAGEKRKTVFFISLFSGSLISNSTAWLIRYLAGGFVVLFPLSQIMIALPALCMTYTALKEMWFYGKGK